ncbi:MAG TPA: SBBP repeat-containing protein, partial [Bacillota bacterium]|nr:SBBP repeat-containing protein [Bacillota bacterium]
MLLKRVGNRKRVLQVVSILFILLVGPGLSDPIFADDEIPGFNNFPAMPFVENQGQTDPSVRFYSDSSRGTMHVGNTEVVYMNNIKECFLGASLRTQPCGIDAAPLHVNYFLGKASDRWLQGVKTYDKVMMGEMYPDIQVELVKRGQDTEKIFTVFPGGNPQDINIQVHGGVIGLTEAGELAVAGEYGNLVFTRPVAYQDMDGDKVEVEVSYRIMDNNVYGFSLGDYNREYPLIIDPLYYSTYIGGDGDEYLVAMETDDAGNVYILARTKSAFSYSAEGYSVSYAGGWDAMVAKMSPDLTQLLAATYIGGSSDDYPKDMMIADNGDLLIVGETYSSDFPVTAGVFAETLTGDSDAFIVRLSPDLSELRASTYYGGEDSDSTDTGNAIAVNSQGRIYIAGTTGSKELPMTDSGYKITKTLGNYDKVVYSEAYVAAFSPDLTDLLA